ncbi:MAG TPA: DinB family protein [Flavobacterium sp.]|jgi:uncharacterized damage-inducible protein DinB
MEITKIDTFLAYFEKTREITIKVIEAIPHDKIDWAYLPGKFTIADLIRHMAAIERYVFAEISIGNKSGYKGCGKELADGYGNIVSYFNEMHHQSINIFKSVTDDRLESKVRSVDGREIELRNFLRALIVHEVHHRAVLCIYLNLLGVQTPSIIGLKEEEVIELSK